MQPAKASDLIRWSELFESVQGEGASAGRRALFLRLAFCNLKCAWCDSDYTWNFAKYDRRAEVREHQVGWVAREIIGREPTLLIITGGEPLLQQQALEALLGALPSELLVEVETNGTRRPEPRLFQRVDQFNVSPKLANSGEPRARRVRPGVLRELSSHRNAWLKLVVRDCADLEEADALVRELAWPASRVLLMPEGSERGLLVERSHWLEPACAARGYRFSPRLHILLWGNQRGI